MKKRKQDEQILNLLSCNNYFDGSVKSLKYARHDRGQPRQLPLLLRPS